MSVRPNVGTDFEHVHGRGCSAHLSRVARARSVAFSGSDIAHRRCNVSAPAGRPVLHPGIAVVRGIAGVHAVLPCVQHRAGLGA